MQVKKLLFALYVTRWSALFGGGMGILISLVVLPFTLETVLATLLGVLTGWVVVAAIKLFSWSDK